MKVYYVCIILIDISTKGTLLHFKVYINFLLSSPFWPFEYLKPLNKTSAIFSVVPALVPRLPSPRCVLLHPAQRGQPVQLAQQLRQVRTLCYLSPGDHPWSCYRGTMLPLSRYDDVRTEERMNLEDCYQHCKVTITNSVLLLRKHFRVVKLNILFPGCRQSQVRGPG